MNHPACKHDIDEKNYFTLDTCPIGVNDTFEEPCSICTHRDSAGALCDFCTAHPRRI